MLEAHMEIVGDNRMRISSGPSRWLVLCFFSILTALLAGCGGGSNDDSAPVAPGVTVTALSLTPAEPSVALGETQQIVANAKLSDGTSKNVSGFVEWTNTADTVATINATGLVTSHSQGVTTITASYNGFVQSISLTVGPAKVVEVQVTPASASVPKGANKQLVAMAIYSDHTKAAVTSDASWISTDPDSVGVDASGLVSAKLAGETAVSVMATYAGVTGSSSITATAASLKSIAVCPVIANQPGCPADATIAKGGFVQPFVATGTYTDGTTADLTTQATWAASNPEFAAISNTAGTNGIATSGASAGATTVTATFQGITSPAVGLTVSNDTLESITVTPTTKTLLVGQGQQFKAVGSFGTGASTPDTDMTTVVRWTTSDPTILAFDDERPGYAVSQKASADPQTVFAKFGDDPAEVAGGATVTVAASQTQPVTIRILPDSPLLPRGFTRPLAALATYADGSSKDITAEVTWTSSDSSKALVSNEVGHEGVVGTTTGSKLGTATISAAFPGSSVKGTTKLTVTDAVLASIAITPPAANIPLGSWQRFTALGSFSDGSDLDLSNGQVRWYSSDYWVAPINPVTGYASGNAQGSALIRAWHPDGDDAVPDVTSPDVPVTVAKEGVTYITVWRGVIDCDSPFYIAGDISPGASYQYTACAYYDTGDSHDVTSIADWSVGDTNVVTVGNTASDKGRVTAVAHGTTVISATLDGVKGEVSVSVGTVPSSGDYPLLRISPVTDVSLSNSSRSAALDLRLYSDENHFSVVTEAADWSIVDTTYPLSAVRISNESGSKGELSVHGLILLPGTVTVAVTYPGFGPVTKTVTVKP